MIKIAMVHMDASLKPSGLHCRMILQVHDELLLAPPPPNSPPPRPRALGRLHRLRRGVKVRPPSRAKRTTFSFRTVANFYRAGVRRIGVGAFMKKATAQLLRAVVLRKKVGVQWRRVVALIKKMNAFLIKAVVRREKAVARKCRAAAF